MSTRFAVFYALRIFQICSVLNVHQYMFIRCSPKCVPQYVHQYGHVLRNVFRGMYPMIIISTVHVHRICLLLNIHQYMFIRCSPKCVPQYVHQYGHVLRNVFPSMFISMDMFFGMCSSACMIIMSTVQHVHRIYLIMWTSPSTFNNVWVDAGDCIFMDRTFRSPEESRFPSLTYQLFPYPWYNQTGKLFRRTWSRSSSWNRANLL